MIDKTTNTITYYGGAHVGTRGSLASIRATGPEDFSENIPDEDVEWEQLVRIAMMSQETSFSERWSDWEAYDESNIQIELLSSRLWGIVGYKKQEQIEPPFGRR